MWRHYAIPILPASWFGSGSKPEDKGKGKGKKEEAPPEPRVKTQEELDEEYNLQLLLELPEEDLRLLLEGCLCANFYGSQNSIQCDSLVMEFGTRCEDCVFTQEGASMTRGLLWNNKTREIPRRQYHDYTYVSNIVTRGAVTRVNSLAQRR
ncbi:hypothetical protein B0T26DRAFT_503352 [Lasiosphaeria miniovina]|uniref:Uncharacterized protein n=1 Tax=Lasiosphaeria miniovina TaxID=1954250 RepID=A0AA39ZTT9_9PEZI|nr:uncharacterized protein B0T26DRAFT_503352 [Lasiosphaeria miniovina]KAK0703528.1 hypothetical protein B0T26DRAFT_503352 [Lasiosphaeria miniovina]